MDFMSFVHTVDPTFAFLSAACLLKYGVAYMSQGKRPTSAKPVATVSRLSVFPVKSMRRMEVREVVCTCRGVKLVEHDVYDRSFMVVNKDMIMMAATQLPKLATINTSVEGEFLVLKKDGYPTFKVSKIIAEPDAAKIVRKINVLGQDIDGQDCGDEAADWISAAADKPGCRLICFPLSGIDTRWCGTNKKMKKDVYRWNTPPAKKEDQVQFQNALPYLMASVASLEDVNKKLDQPVTMDRFRPNIEVTGCGAFAEETWREVWIGENRFINQVPCDRCPHTTVNPETGLKDASEEPLKTLRRYRSLYTKGKGSFGVHLMLDGIQSGSVKVGDTVYALMKD